MGGDTELHDAYRQTKSHYTSTVEQHNQSYESEVTLSDLHHCSRFAHRTSPSGRRRNGV